MIEHMTAEAMQKCLQLLVDTYVGRKITMQYQSGRAVTGDCTQISISPLGVQLRIERPNDYYWASLDRAEYVRIDGMSEPHADVDEI